MWCPRTKLPSIPQIHLQLDGCAHDCRQHFADRFWSVQARGVSLTWNVGLGLLGHGHAISGAAGADSGASVVASACVVAGAWDVGSSPGASAGEGGVGAGHTSAGVVVAGAWDVGASSSAGEGGVGASHTSASVVVAVVVAGTRDVGASAHGVCAGHATTGHASAGATQVGAHARASTEHASACGTSNGGGWGVLAQATWGGVADSSISQASPACKTATQQLIPGPRTYQQF